MKRTLTIAALIIVAIALIGAFLFGRANPAQGHLNKLIAQAQQKAEAQQAERLKQLSDEISRLQDQLRQSNQRYVKLKGLIKQKAQQAQEIKTPTTDDEMRDRFSKLGYPPVR